MKTTTKLFALGAMGAAVYGASRLLRSAGAKSPVDSKFDASDVHDISDIRDTTDVQMPIVVTEEVLVITESGPYDAELELVSIEDVTRDR